MKNYNLDDVVTLGGSQYAVKRNLGYYLRNLTDMCDNAEIIKKLGITDRKKWGSELGIPSSEFSMTGWGPYDSDAFPEVLNLEELALLINDLKKRDGQPMESPMKKNNKRDGQPMESPMKKNNKRVRISLA